jgi:hypothetical protein
MSGLGIFLGGLSHAYEGYEQGQQDAIKRQNDIEDRQYLRQQRDYELGQQQRTIAQQAREDQLRKDLQAIKPAGTPDGSSAPPASTDGASTTDDDSGDATGDDGSADATAVAPAPIPPVDSSLSGYGGYGLDGASGDMTAPAPAPAAAAAPAPAPAAAATPVSAPSAGVTPPPAGAAATGAAAAAPAAAPTSAAAAPSAGAATQPVAAPAAAGGKIRTQDQELMDVANAYQKAGQYDTAMRLRTAAMQIGMQRAANEFLEIKASSAGKTPFEIAQEAAQVFNHDPMPTQVTGVKDLGANGVQITINDRQIGGEHTRTFANPQQLIDALESYYSPQTYQALAAQRAKYQLDMQAKLAEHPYTPVMGGFVNNATGQFTRTRDYNVNNGKQPPSPSAQVQSMIDDISEKGDTKLQPTQLAAAKDYGDRLINTNPGLPPERAARIATDVAQDPTKTTVAVNPDTGTVDLAYDDQDGRRYTLTPNFTSPALEAAKPKLTPDQTAQLKDSVRSMVMQAPQNEQRSLVAAAFDPNQRQQLLAQVQQSAQQVINDAIQKAKASGQPVNEDAIRQNGIARTQQAIQALQRKLDLVKAYGDPKMVSQQGANSITSNLTSLLNPGGIPGYEGSNAPVPPQFQAAAARADATQAQAVAAQQRKAAQAQAARASQQQAVGWLTPARIDAMNGDEVQRLLGQYGTQLTSDQARRIYSTHYHDLTPAQMDMLQRQF